MGQRDLSVPQIPRISVIVPALNEERVIAATLRHTRAVLEPHELIVVDTGSRDGTAQCAAPFAQVMREATTRGGALNRAVKVATGDVLLFLHADTLLPSGAAAVIGNTLADPAVIGGAFQIQLDDRRPIARLVAWSVNRRSALLNTFFGDQAMFVRRAAFLECGGFRAWNVMDDLEILSRLRPIGRLTVVRAAVVTSARRHRRSGWLRTIVTIWLISIFFRLGVPGQTMARFYKPKR